MAEFTPLDGVNGGAAFDGFDERFYVPEEGGGVLALTASDGAVQDAQPQGIETGEFVRFLGDEFVGEDVGTFAEEVVAKQEERLRGYDGLIALTGGASVPSASITRRRPGRSVTRNRPSGKNASDQGCARPEATT